MTVFKITNGLTIAEYVSRNMVADKEEIPGRDDIARCAELAALDDVVNANIRQMAGPWPIADKDGS